ncbi:MAG TPA: NAD(P)/FAD-dependent oxidoreductase, partial [Polyangiales bacterium]|nr:NAD(P)/FAD-dependent oxidoreductase [Polyangiales bacterium]
MAEHFDVVIVGAGISGIGAACHFQRKCPNKSFVLLEGRDATGGTWDLFRYPGIRSDSDMYTLGYGWKPWLGEKAIADGASILNYVRETARENGIDDKIRFRHKVIGASWSSERAQWTVEAERGPEREPVRFTCRFLYAAPGYYAYDAGYTPEFAGSDEFAGRIVHPQHWPADLDYAGKRVVVIGSGATAMTLVPEMAKQAAEVVMLQRSPSYVVSVPARDPLAAFFRSIFAEKVAYALTRWKNVIVGLLFFHLTRLMPVLAKRALVERARRDLGRGYDVERHFTPRYNVWDQRVCLVPDGDLFEAIRAGKVTVVTDHIDRFTQDGIRLQSGQELVADVIVTATGLQLQPLGGFALTVDGRRMELSQTMNYKGCMFSDLPNLAWAFGYTNASWTLKADLTAEYVCKLLNHMDAVGAVRCVPRRRDRTVEERPWLDFSS